MIRNRAWAFLASFTSWPIRQGREFFILTVIVSGLRYISRLPLRAYRLILLAADPGKRAKSGITVGPLSPWPDLFIYWCLSLQCSHLTAFLRDIATPRLRRIAPGWFGKKPPEMSGNRLRKTWKIELFTLIMFGFHPGMNS